MLHLILLDLDIMVIIEVTRQAHQQRRGYIKELILILIKQWLQLKPGVLRLINHQILLIKKQELLLSSLIKVFQSRKAEILKNFSFGTHVAGSNPDVSMAPPIDIFSNFLITENKNLEH